MVDVPSYDKLFIGGDWVTPASDRRFEVVNPATLDVVGSTPEAVEADVDAAVAAARRAFDEGPWPSTPAAERAEVMQRLLDGIYARADELAQVITAEMGSPILFSHFAQVGASAMVLDYFVGLTRTYPFEEVRPGFLGPALVRREPVGVRERDLAGQPGALGEAREFEPIFQAQRIQHELERERVAMAISP